ncbi:MAG: hypothetical protein AMXMBFR77_04930 [Phycisphaerales bacterium]|nr:MAG: hypothetical protein BroJett004_23590 [Planctomycetota bacterium]
MYTIPSVTAIDDAAASASTHCIARSTTARRNRSTAAASACGTDRWTGFAASAASRGSTISLRGDPPPLASPRRLAAQNLLDRNTNLRLAAERRARLPRA